jgi:N-methylhydantoinase B/oxoprolinase/acetone carboxylase alpha subunit
VALGDRRRLRQEGVRGGEDAAVIGELFDHRQQWRHRLRCAPRPHGDAGDLVAGEVEGGEGCRGVFKQVTRGLVMVVLASLETLQAAQFIFGYRTNVGTRLPDRCETE